MERGTGKSSTALPRDFRGLYLNDSAVHGGQWPSSLPPSRAAAEACSMRKMPYDNILPLGFQASPHNLASQTFFSQCLNPNGRDANSYRSTMNLGANRSHMAERFCVPAPALRLRQLSLQMDAGGKTSSVNDSSLGGSFLQRNPPKQQAPPEQLTIFYRGAVLVYDGVSRDQAEEIMLAADNRPKLVGSNFAKSGSVATSIDPMHVKDPIPTDAPEITHHNAETSGDSVSLTLAIGSLTTSHEDMATLSNSRPSSAAPLKLVDATVDSSCSSANMPRAIPQARRASIARFLEKRKDRLINCMPFCYNSNKSP